MRLIVILIFSLSLLPKIVHAIYDPRTVPNNKYGIHIADTNDIADTAQLINSSGGDWGYVTLVIQQNDRDPSKWQKIFDQMRRLHLIPIVRIATYAEGNSWAKPNVETIESWVNFLDVLNWPVENRYIVIFNEPNHAKEWGNTIDPEGYAEIFVRFAQSLKAKSEDFFILSAGLDVSAASTYDSLDAAIFLSRMTEAQPNFLSLMDGWTSHSYPNPAFSGAPTAHGRGTLRTYLWELQYLKNLGLTKDLPVFITETGWIHNKGIAHNAKLLSSESVGVNLQTASSLIWQDPAIVAITPFIFNYQGLPFDHFSWKVLGGEGYYPHFYAYQNIQKSKGEPKQYHSFQLASSLFPDSLVASSSYTFLGNFINQGQAIVGTNEGYELILENYLSGLKTLSSHIPTFAPNESSTVSLHVQTPQKVGKYSFKLLLVKGANRYVLEVKTITLVPPPSINLHISLGLKKTAYAPDSTILIYDGDTLLHKISGVRVKNGSAKAEGLTDIIPGQEYRVVVLVPYYIPRQTIHVLSSGQTEINMPRFLLLDPNGDGALTPADLIAAFQVKPHKLLRLLIGP